MKNKILKYLIHSIILLLSFTFYLSPQLFGQPQIENIEKTEISGGAEFNIMLQEAIRNGNVDMFRSFGQSTPPPPYSPSAITVLMVLTLTITRHLTAVLGSSRQILVVRRVMIEL